MYGGYVVSPLNLLAQDAQLEYTLAHSDTRIVFAAAANRERARSAFVASSGAAFDVSSSIDVRLRLDVARAACGRVAVTAPLGRRTTPAMLMYTSGTTGQPKGALLSHAQPAVGAAARSRAPLALTPADRVLSSLPLYHINGQCIATVAPLVSRRQHRDAASLQRVAMVAARRAPSADVAQRGADDHRVSAERAGAHAGTGGGVPRRALRPLGVGAAAARAASRVRGALRHLGDRGDGPHRMRVGRVHQSARPVARASTARPGRPLGVEARVVDARRQPRRTAMRAARSSCAGRT